MGKSRADEMKAYFLKLSPIDQIHIAIERESQTERGTVNVQRRYSRERIETHNEWRKQHRGLLELFNLG